MTTDFTLVAGDSRTLTIPITDESGNNVDVSDALAIRYGLFNRDGTVAASKNLDGGLSVAVHVVTVIILPADTLGMIPGKYPHELEITLANDEVHTVLQGYVNVKKGYLDNV